MANLQAYTEQAISLLHGKLPSIVWLPPSIRKQARVTPEGVVTKNDPDQAEQLRRIAALDPIGFLGAIMNGQPIVTFRCVPAGETAKIDKRRAVARLGEEKGVDIIAEYHTPSVADRERVATFLSQFVAGPAQRQRFKQRGGRAQDDDTEADAMFANAAARGDQDAEREGSQADA